jgi:hypothetical protein
MANTKTASTRSKKSMNSRSKSVLQMTMGGKKLKRFSSISQAGLVTGVDPSNISKATRGVYQTAGGFRWQA